MEVVDLQSRREQEDIVDVLEILQNAVNAVETNGMESVMVLMKYPDGQCEHICTALSNVEWLGMLELTKARVLQDAWEEE